MWYLEEGALFQIFGTHDIEENTSMDCPFRCGRGKIEFNPSIIDALDDKKLELYLKAEVIRILLKHPYERQPDGCRRSSMSLGSNLVLSDNYDFDDIGLPKPEQFQLQKQESYEWYSYQIEQLSKSHKEEKKSKPGDEKNQSDQGEDNDNQKGSDGDEGNGSGEKTGDDEGKNKPFKDNSNGKSGSLTGNDTQEDGFTGDFIEIQLPDGTTMKLPRQSSNQKESDNADSETEERLEETRTFDNNPQSGDLSQLWQEDAMRSCEIDITIDEIEANNSWGSLAGNIADLIMANTKAKVDYRKVLSGFRASVLSNKRHLTRMRPNRRSGFDNMGSIRRFNTNILVAVDVSGSVDDKSLSHFFSIVNRAFKYGIENIDVVQFDTELKEVEKMEKAQKKIHIVGRGGTSFQPVFDYVSKHPEYDGLLIFTDGYAPKPKRPKNLRCKVAWICNTLESYEKNYKWMSETGRCCSIQL